MEGQGAGSGERGGGDLLRHTAAQTMSHVGCVLRRASVLLLRHALQTFPADMAPGARDARMAIAEQLGAARGEPLSRRVLQRLLDAETVAGVDQVAASKLLRGVMSPEQLRERVAARQLQQQQQKQTHVPVALA